MDVVGVVTPLVREVAQVLHGDQDVELRVQLAVQEVEGKEEDREGQVGCSVAEPCVGLASMERTLLVKRWPRARNVFLDTTKTSKLAAVLISTAVAGLDKKLQR